MELGGFLPSPARLCGATKLLLKDLTSVFLSHSVFYSPIESKKKYFHLEKKWGFFSVFVVKIKDETSE